MKKRLSELGDAAKVSPGFAGSCFLDAPDDFNWSALNLSILGNNPSVGLIEDVEIVLQRNVRGKISVLLFAPASGSKIEVGSDVHLSAEFRVQRASTFIIGSKTTINGARFQGDDSIVEIGADCMFSDEILVQASDQHGLIDLTTSEITNKRTRMISLGDHVWVARRSVLMPDCTIGEGSVVAAGAIVTKSFGPFSYIAGSPARVVRTQASWTRDPMGKSAWEEQFFRDRFTPE